MAKRKIKQSDRDIIIETKHINLDSYVSMVIFDELKSLIDFDVCSSENKKELKKIIKIFAIYSSDPDKVSWDETTSAFALLANNYEDLIKTDIIKIISEELNTFIDSKVRIHNDTKELAKDVRKANKIFKMYVEDEDSVGYIDIANGLQLFSKHFHRLWT